MVGHAEAFVLLLLLSQSAHPASAQTKSQQTSEANAKKCMAAAAILDDKARIENQYDRARQNAFPDSGTAKAP